MSATRLYRISAVLFVLFAAGTVSLGWAAMKLRAA